MRGIEGVRLKEEVEALPLVIIHLLTYFYGYVSLEVIGNGGT